MSTKKIVPALAVEQEENKDLKIVRGDSNNFQSMVSEIETEKKLLDKWRKIDDAEKKIKNFNLAHDELSDHLTIEDGEGNEFTTANGDIIKEVLQLVHCRIANMKNVCEAEIATRRNALQIAA